MRIVDTQAGDDSEGKMWGLEGSNILIALAGLAIGVSVAVWMFTFCATPPLTALGYGVIPAILGIVYVFTLREGRPRSFDRDLFETFLSGRSWQAKPLLKPHPLFLPLVIFGLFPLGSLHAQFVPSQQTDVEGNKNYEFTLIRDEPYGIYIGATVLWTANGTLHTARIFLNDQQVLLHQSSNGDTGSGQQTGYISRLVKGTFAAGTKIRLKGIVEAPGDPGARLFALGAQAVGYDAAVNLTNLERKINSLETVITNLSTQVDQNAVKIDDITKQIINLKTELSDLRQRLAALELEHSQFKTDVNLRLAAVDKRIVDVENKLRRELSELGRRFDEFQIDNNQFKANVNSRIDAVDRRFNTNLNKLARRTRFNSTLGIIGTSLGGGTAVLLGGGAIASAVNEHKSLHEAYEQEQSMEEIP